MSYEFCHTVDAWGRHSADRAWFARDDRTGDVVVLFCASRRQMIAACDAYLDRGERAHPEISTVEPLRAAQAPSSGR